jgi:WhiB family redox-sensing transcriptional regulator
VITRQEIPEWVQSAVCGQVDPEIFYPPRGDSCRDAKRVCLSCPVRVECLRWALDSCEEHGVWGGKSERERRALRRQERQVAA